MKRQNCWEAKRCCKEIGNINNINGKICPASTSKIYNGINKGKNAGRFCWNVENTLCFSDTNDGNLDKKLLKCYNCSFFKMVNEEESRAFVIISAN